MMHLSRRQLRIGIISGTEKRRVRWMDWQLPAHMFMQRELRIDGQRR